MRAAFGAALLAALLVLPSCVLVEYSDNLVDETTGRSGFVTKPAALGGIVGFVAGIPIDLAVLPVSYLVYRSQKDEEEEGLDPLSTLLFPSFVLWRAGILVVGTPLDVLEFVFYRAWRAEPPPDQVELDEGLGGEDGATGGVDGGGLGRADPRLP